MNQPLSLLRPMSSRVVAELNVYSFQKNKEQK